MSWDTDNTWNTGLPTPPPTYTPPGYTYRPRTNPYLRNSPDELNRMIAEQERKLVEMRDALASYGENPVMLWECEECGNRFVHADDCIEHLEDIHHYPHEDACLSTLKVWTRG